MDLKTFRPPKTIPYTPPLLEGMSPAPVFDLVPLRQSWRQKIDELRYDSRVAVKGAAKGAKAATEAPGDEQIEQQAMQEWGGLIASQGRLIEIRDALLRAHLVEVRGIDNGGQPATLEEVLAWLREDGEHVAVELVAHLVSGGTVSSTEGNG